MHCDGEINIALDQKWHHILVSCQIFPDIKRDLRFNLQRFSHGANMIDLSYTTKFIKLRKDVD